MNPPPPIASHESREGDAAGVQPLSLSSPSAPSTCDGDAPPAESVPSAEPAPAAPPDTPAPAPDTPAPALDAAGQLLADIDALLKMRGAPDEACGKQVRKRYNGLVADGGGEDELAAVARALRTLREKIDRQVRQRRERVRAVRSDLQQCAEQLNQGHLKAALNLEKKIRKETGRIPGLSAASGKGITDALEALQPQLKQLRDTQSWSTNRAREMLIQQVVSLQKGSLPVREVSRRIQQARDTWRGWDHTGESAPTRLWKQFDRACTEAYAPCKAHFAEQAAMHDEALHEYEALCASLEVAVKAGRGDDDWSHLDNLLRKSRARKRKLALRRKDLKSMERRFNEALAGLNELLEPERRRNLRRREQLIENLRALHEAGDVAKAVPAVKDAQAGWRPTVLSGEAVEKRLWSAFRAVCDEIFEKKKQTHREVRDGEQQNLRRREAACARVREILEGDDDAVRAAAGEITRLRESWSELGPVPKRARDTIEKEFRACLGDHRKRLQGIRTAHSGAVDNALAERAALCVRLEAALYAEDAEGAEGGAALLEQSRKAWDAAAAVDDPQWSAPLQQRFEAAASALGEQAARAAVLEQHRANLAAVREICLHLEVLGGVDSPPECAAERLQLQARRLAGAMSRKGEDQDDASVFQSLCRRYWSAGGVAAAEAQVLEQRFQAARAAFAVMAARPKGTAKSAGEKSKPNKGRPGKKRSRR